MLFPHITNKKRQMQRQERTGHFHVNSKEEWYMFYDGVNHREQSSRQFTQDLRQWHKSSIEAEKNISQGSIGPYNTPNNCKPKTDFQQKFTFHICSNHVLISDITSLKRQVQRQERTGQFHVNSKEEWNKLYDGEYSSAEQSTNYTRLAAMTQVFHRSRKKRLTRKHWTLQHAKTTVNREKCPSKISPLKYIWPMCYSHTSQTKNARCRDRREQVISTSTPKRSGTCFKMVWIIECRASDITQDLRQWHKSSIEAEKNISQGSIGPYNTPNNCKPKTDFQQKFTFHICSNHVLISDITSLKRQVQRQERTGHFHVNSKEEWNKLYDGVNIRVQINRQITQDLRQWHKSSIEAEKNISQGSIGPYNTPKQLWTWRKIEQKISLSIMFHPYVIPKHHKQKTPDAETGENRSVPRQLQRGVEHVLRWCESSSAEQPTNYTRLAAMTQVFHRSRKKYLTRTHWTLQHAKTTVNREKCPSKISPLKYIWPMC